MNRKECIAIILAGDSGAGLGTLTSNTAKSAVYFGGKYRLIDFALSNCANSGIDTAGIIMKYKPTELHKYISDGQTWNLDNKKGKISLLYPTEDTLKNIAFIEKVNPKNILVIPGSHVYKMDYGKMIYFHKITEADITIVAKRDISLTPMDIFIIKWEQLRKHIYRDGIDLNSKLLSSILAENGHLCTYLYDGYWNDVETLQSFWKSNIDLIKNSSGLNLSDINWKISTKPHCEQSSYIWNKARIKGSIIGAGCTVFGRVTNSVLSHSVTVSSGAEIIDSVIMPNVVISKNAKIYKAVVGAGSSIGENARIGANDGLDIFRDNEICSNDISLIAPGIYIDKNTRIIKNSHVNRNLLIHEIYSPLVRRGIAKRELNSCW